MQEEELKELKATKALKETDLKKFEVRISNSPDEAGDFGSELTVRALCATPRTRNDSRCCG
jgi:hypothetical protein